ncbi:MAG TPA: hypothetical protein VGN77_01520 [Steroidobacteraceae bacterium]|nr:hypothetical protein [Steroidobacteraceae bacterium]
MGRLLIPRCLVAALALAQVCSADEFDLGVDLRAVTTDATQSRLTGGLGKLRFDDTQDGLRLGYVELGYRADPTETLHFSAQGYAYGDHDVNVFDLTELYAEWRPIPASDWRSRIKVGAFYPSISLENRMQGWRSPYTVSFSAINTWIGEELRTIGAEYNLDWLGRSHGHDFDVTLSAAAYGWNDTAGTVIATRGWGLHDRQSTLFGRYANNGSPLSERTLFFDDLDKRAGYYVGATANYRGLLEVRALHYDNRANLAVESTSLDDSAWLTFFDSLGARLTPNDDWTLIGQWLHGRTYVDTHVPQVAWSYDSEFLLASLKRGAMRYSVRYDRYQMQQTYSTFGYIPILLADDGHAWTVACIRDFGRHWSMALEGTESDSTVPLRALLGDAPYARERVLQLSVRYDL